MRIKKFHLALLGGTAVALFIFGAVMLGARPLQNALLTVLSPFTGAAVRTMGWFSDVRGMFDQLGNGSTENERLKAENQRLTGMLEAYGDTQKENDLLRKQLQVSSPKKLSLILANVVSFDPLSGSSVVLIDMGTNDGVREGMPVVRSGNVLVGKVVQTYAGFSRVGLISDPNTKVSVKTAGSDTSGVLSGSVGNLLLFDLIDKNASLNKGDLVVTSGLDGTYPKDLIVGWVEDIISNQEAIFKQAHLTPAYGNFSQTQVFVISNYLK